MCYSIRDTSDSKVEAGYSMKWQKIRTLIGSLRLVTHCNKILMRDSTMSQTTLKTLTTGKSVLVSSTKGYFNGNDNSDLAQLARKPEIVETVKTKTRPPLWAIAPTWLLA